MTRNTLVAATVFYAIGNGVFAGLPLLLLPVLTQHLGAAGYGHWVAFTVVVAALVSLGGLGAHGFVVVEWPKYALPAQHGGLLLGSLTVGTAGIVAATMLLMAFLWLTPIQIGLDPRWVPTAGLLAVFTAVALVCASVWQSRAQAVQYMVFRVLHALVLAGATVVALLAWRTSWTDLAWAYVAVAGFAAVASLMLHRPTFSAGASDVQCHIAHATRFGVGLLPHSMGGVAMSAIDKLMVGALLTAADLGAYGVAWQLCLVLSLLTDSANRSYAPWLYAFLAAGKHQQARLALRLVRSTYLALAALLLVSLVFGVALKGLVAAFATPDYVAASACVLPISIGHGLTGAYYMVVNYVMFKQRFLILALVSIGAGATNVALALLFIPVAGIEGAAWAFAASQAVLFLGAWWLAARQVPMPWRLRRNGMP